MKKSLLLFVILLMTCAGYAQVIRGPYLQTATSTSMVVRWRTDMPTSSQVQYGTGSLAFTQKVSDDKLVNDHEIKISGLTPNTRYFYSIGTTSAVFQANDETYFQTAPAVGAIGQYRFGVLGDCGTNSAFQGNVRDQLSAYLGSRYMNALILLGDNAYALGTDPEYQSNFFNHYKDSFLKKFPVFPTPGNHDYNNDNFDRQNDHKVPYYDIFSPPIHGEAGGVASETKSYYSYDYGNVHFLSLDSYGREDQATRLYDTLGKQVQWIKADLAANKNKGWVVAYWHHPPFSQGSRNSETELDMIKIRENFIRILERNGVDLILCGHSHVYERTSLINGFYGYQDTFNSGIHNLSQSSGKYDGSQNSCPYFKTSSQNKGTVYVVSGSAGQLGVPAGGYPHKAMFYSNADHGGAMMLEVQGNRLDAKWIGIDGVIRDQFTIEKDVNLEKTITIEQGSSTTLTASFVGSYEWSNGATSKSISVSPSSEETYEVKDPESCVRDVFHVKVVNPVTLNAFTRTVETGNLVRLNWATSAENGLSHFEIEKSNNGVTFGNAGRVNATGNSTTLQNYQYLDESEKNTAGGTSRYYRLKMVSLSGQAQYSRILEVVLRDIILGADPTVAMDIEIVPNPSTNDDIQMRLIGADQAEANISVVDISGKTVFTKPLRLNKDLIPFLPKSISKGTYILKVMISNRTITKKFVIL